MKYTPKDGRIKFGIDWLKGIKMDIPNSKWVMFTIGIYVLAAAFDKFAPAFISFMRAMK